MTEGGGGGGGGAGGAGLTPEKLLGAIGAMLGLGSDTSQEETKKPANDNEKKEYPSCPPTTKTKPKRPDQLCRFRNLAVVELDTPVSAGRGYGELITCIYQYPRKGIKKRAFRIAFKSANPAFLCPRVLPESSFP